MQHSGSIQLSHQRLYQSPLPPPEIMAGYKEVGYADDVIRLTEMQLAARNTFLEAQAESLDCEKRCELEAVIQAGNLQKAQIRLSFVSFVAIIVLVLLFLGAGITFYIIGRDILGTVFSIPAFAQILHAIYKYTVIPSKK